MSIKLHSSISFGSQARGDNDDFSDVDILIVREKTTIDDKDTHKHYYTKKRLLSLKKAESLFLVHLKKEGKIIEDKSGWLQSFLSNVPDFTADENRIGLVKKYLSILLSMNPSNNQKLWWSDCIYVFLRDYLIKYNSKYGVYSFSPFMYGKPIGQRESDLTEVILDLRYQKSKYRSKNEISENRLDIKKIKSHLTNVLGIDLDRNRLLDVFLDSSIALEQYFKLRLLEGLYLNKEVEITDKKIIKYMQSPHSYNWNIKNTKLEDHVRIIS